MLILLSCASAYPALRLFLCTSTAHIPFWYLSSSSSSPPPPLLLNTYLCASGATSTRTTRYAPPIHNINPRPHAACRTLAILPHCRHLDTPDTLLLLPPACPHGQPCYLPIATWDRHHHTCRCGRARCMWRGLQGHPVRRAPSPHLLLALPSVIWAANGAQTGGATVLGGQTLGNAASGGGGRGQRTTRKYRTTDSINR